MSDERSRYGERQRPNAMALAGSLAVVGLLLSSLLTLQAAGTRRENSSLAVFDVLLDVEVPPPESRPEPEPVTEPVDTPVAIMAPEPPIRITTRPIEIATSPAPSPPRPVVIPGPPVETPRAAPPGIESVGDLASSMISATPPRYPAESRRRREQGVVVLAVVLGLDGTVADISVSESSGHDRLDRAALSAVRHWRWSPTERGGTPVMVRGLVEIPFVLTG